MNQTISIRLTTCIILGMIAFLVGLVGAYFGVRLLGMLGVLAAVLALFSRGKHQRLLVITLPMLGLTIGCLRGQQIKAQLQPIKTLIKQQVVVQGTATSDAVYDDKKELSFQVDHLKIQEPVNVAVPGKLTIGGLGENAIYRGDVVQIAGKLNATRGSSQGSIKFANIHLVSHNVNPIDTIRLKFVAGLQTALPEPLASFGTGLLIGQRSTIPKQVNEELSTVGLTHIVAVSGYNLTIIVMAVLALMKNRSKFQTISVTLALISLFVLLTGFSASIVRAALVSMLSLWAWYYGRTFRPLLLILLAAVLTAGYNPLYLWSDIGWYLSFLAFYGVLLLSPLVKERAFGEKKLGLVGAVVLETLSAQIMTTPIILFIFQQISLVALFSNVLVVPWVPLAMLFTVVAGLAGMLVPVFAGWLAWPARILLTYMLDIIHVFAQVPHARVRRGMGVKALAWSYVLLIGFCLMLWRRTKTKHGIITERKS